MVLEFLIAITFSAKNLGTAPSSLDWHGNADVLTFVTTESGLMGQSRVVVDYRAFRHLVDEPLSFLVE